MTEAPAEAPATFGRLWVETALDEMAADQASDGLLVVDVPLGGAAWNPGGVPYLGPVEVVYERTEAGATIATPREQPPADPFHGLTRADVLRMAARVQAYDDEVDKVRKMIRDRLDAPAIREAEREGTKTTIRGEGEIPTFLVQGGVKSAYVQDRDEFLTWAEQQHPDEVQITVVLSPEQFDAIKDQLPPAAATFAKREVRHSFTDVFLKKGVKRDGDLWIDKKTGEVVPGVGTLTSAYSTRLTITDDAKAAARQWCIEQGLIPAEGSPALEVFRG